MLMSLETLHARYRFSEVDAYHAQLHAADMITYSKLVSTVIAVQH